MRKCSVSSHKVVIYSVKESREGIFNWDIIMDGSYLYQDTELAAKYAIC